MRTCVCSPNQTNSTAKKIQSNFFMGKVIFDCIPNYRYWLVMMESWYLYLKLMMHKVWIPSCNRMGVLEKTHPWDYLCIHSTFLLNGCILTTQTPHALCELAPSLVRMAQDAEQHMEVQNQLLYALDSLAGPWKWNHGKKPKSV